MKLKTAGRIAHAFLLGALILAGVLAGLFALTTTRWFEAYLQHRITLSIEDLTGGRVEVFDLHYQPFLFEVTIGRLEIHGREQAAEPPLFWAQGVQARINPASFIRFSVVLRSVQWSRASLHVRTYPNGSTNIPGPRVSLGIKEALSGLLSLSVKRLRLENTEIHWNAKHLPLQAVSNNLTIFLRLRPGHGYEGNLSASRMLFTRSSNSLPPLSITTQFTFARGRAEVHSLRWELGALRGTAAASLWWIPATEANFNFTADGGVSEVLRALHVRSLRGGQVRLQGEGAYHDAGLNVAGQLRGRQLDFRIPGFHPRAFNVSTDYTVKRQNIKLSRLRADVLNGSLEGDGEVSLQDRVPGFEFQGRVQGADLTSFIASLSGNLPALRLLHPEATVRGTLDASWHGPFERLHSNFNFELRPPARLAPAALPVKGRIAGSINFARSLVVSLQTADLRTPRSTLEAQGDIGTAGIGLHVRLQTSDFEEWRPLAALCIEAPGPLNLVLKQAASFSGIVSGTLTSQVFQGHLQAGRFEYHDWPWDGFEATAYLASNEIKISSASLRQGPSVFKMDGAASLDHWKFQRDSTVHLTLSASRSPIEALRAAFGIETPVAGFLSGDFSLDGTRDSLEGRGALQIVHGHFASEPFDSANSRVEVKHSVWSFQDIHIGKAQARAAGNARLDYQARAFSTDLHGEHLPVADLLPSTGVENRATSNPPLQGTANFELHAEGSFENPRAALKASVAGLRLYGTAMGHLQMEASLQGEEISAWGTALGAGGQINFSGRGQTKASSPIQVSGTFKQLRLDHWVHFFSRSQVGAEIIASGDFSLAGPLKIPQLLDGRGTIQSLEINFPSLDLRNERPAEIAYSNRSFRLGSVRLRGPGTNFEAQGSMEFGGVPSVSLDLTGNADAALLGLLDPALQASGSSQLKIHLGGPAAAPLLRGALSVNDVSMGYGDLPFRLSGLSGTIDLQGERAVIAGLRGTVGAGVVSLSGFITLQRVPRYEIRASIQQVRIRHPSDFTSVLDGSMVLSGSEEHGRLDGDLALRNVYVSENLNLFNLIANGNHPAGQTAVASPLASRISLGVRVASAPAVQIETRNVRLLAEVDLRIQGSLANPVALGAIHARSGDAVFRGNRYTITRGEIALNNPFRTEPVLDLEAQTRVQRYDLSLQVSGPFDRLRFSYRSDPPLPTEDIVSLLALGYSRRSQEMGTTSNRSFSSVGASALLSEALSTQLSGRIQELFGVSRINIDPNVEELGPASGPRVTVEQQLSPDLTLTYITSTANSQYRVIQFEWDVSQDVSVVGIRDRNGIFGLELKFRRRFK